MSSMSDRSSQPLVLLLAGVVVALGAVGVLFVRTERKMAKLEEQLARTPAAAPAPRQVERAATPVVRWSPPPTAGADPAQAEASPHRRARQAEELRAPAQPKMPEARKFAEDNEVTEIEWRTLTRLNQSWMDSVKKAAEQGEESLPDSLEYVAKQRDLKLRAVLGSDEAMTDYKHFEGALQDQRVTYKAKDGTVYGAAPFE
jgi:hypothetical protein